MPDYARNAHGNLAEQNRTFGPYRGIDTTLPASTVALATDIKTESKPAMAVSAAASPAAAPASAAKPEIDIKPLLNKYTCTACHGMNNKMVGPSFAEIAKKHPGKVDYLANKIKAGGQGVWGAIPMPAQNIPASEAQAIANWLSKGMK
jgi:cytochrome c